MASLVSAPVFQDEERSQRARVLFRVVWLVMGTTTAFLLAIMLVQPAVLWRAVTAVSVVNSLGLGLLWLNSQAQTTAASWVLVLGLIVLVTLMSLQAGGIRSPGVTLYFVFVLMGGVLLGFRQGIFIAILCSLLAFGLVLLEGSGQLPRATVVYTPQSLWLLNTMYIGVVVVLLRLSTDAVSGALSRARTELAVRKDAERRLDMALDAGGVGTWDYEVAAGHFIGDARAFAIFGLDRPGRAVPISEWAALLHEDDSARVGSILNALSTGAQADAVLAYRIRRPDGTERDVEVAAQAFERGDAQRRHVVGTVLDATARRAADRERNALLFNLNERVKELRVLHGVTKLVRRDSDIDLDLLREIAACLPQGWQHPESCMVRVVAGPLEAHTANWTDTPWRMEARQQTTAGIVSVEVGYVEEHPTAAEGPFLAEERQLINSVTEVISTHVQGLHGELRRRALEEQMRQSQKMEALGTLASGIAHDFNNILTAVGGNVELAQLDLPEGHKARRALDEIAVAHTRATDLVRRVLAFARKRAAQKTVIDLPAVVDEALFLLKVSTPKKIRFDQRFEEALPPLLADTTQIHQIVMNLGTNAVHAMQESGGTLSITLDAVTFAEGDTLPSVDLRHGRWARIRIGDTGTGMPPEVLRRLFEPFFTTKGEKGTGLGLSMVHGIVTDHGGAILVDSVIGAGTTFTVYLPAAG